MECIIAKNVDGIQANRVRNANMKTKQEFKGKDAGFYDSERYQCKHCGECFRYSMTFQQHSCMAKRFEE